MSPILKGRLSNQAQAWWQEVQNLSSQISSKSIHQIRVLSRRVNVLLALWSQEEGYVQAKLWEKRLKELNRHLHRFHIALRKWLYTLELWHEAGEVIWPSLQTLKQEQAHSGWIHDLEELREHLELKDRKLKEIKKSKKLLKALRKALKQKVNQEICDLSSSQNRGRSMDS